jgi:hypothetical protein
MKAIIRGFALTDPVRPLSGLCIKLEKPTRAVRRAGEACDSAANICRRRDDYTIQV